MLRPVRLGVTCAALLLSAGCVAPPQPPTPARSTTPGTAPTTTSRPATGTVAASSQRAPTRILFFGNSHTAGHDVPATVARLLRAGAGWAVETTVLADGLLLDARGSHRPSLELIDSGRWDVVVLQAQDYSSSGLYTYSTAGAETLVRRARAAGARPILFAEWPRAGIDESARIVATYAVIAAHEPACLPPVPEAFDEARRLTPGLVLHEPDGNHSAPAGAFLAALILYAAVAGTDPGQAPQLDQPGVPPDVQSTLRMVAGRVVQQVPVTRGCP